MKSLLFMLLAVLILMSGTAMAQLANQASGEDRIVYDMANDVYFYPLLSKMVQMTKDEQRAAIEKLNVVEYCNIKDFQFAKLADMTALAMSAATGATQIMGDELPAPVQFTPVHLNDYFEYTDYFPAPPPGAPPFPPEHYLTMGRTADEEGALIQAYDGYPGIPLKDEDGNIVPDHFYTLDPAKHPTQGQYHIPQLMNPETGNLEVLMFDGDINYVADDDREALMMGRLVCQNSAWAISHMGPKYLKVAVDIEPDNKFNIFKYKDEGMLTVAVLGNKFFDVAEQIIPASITVNKMKVMFIDDMPVYEKRDMNGDGIVDLCVLIDVKGQYFQPGKKTFALKGKLKEKYGGTMVIGRDKVEILTKMNDPELVGWYNMMNGNQRLVYDAMLETFFYPYLNDMLDMTRAQHQEFIDQLNAKKYGGICDWVFASYEQSDGMKMSFGLMADNLEEYSFGPPGPRTPSSPYLAWTVVPSDYFDITSVQMLPPIFGDLPVLTLNGRIYSGWSIRRDGMDMGLPPDVAMRLGNADDHFVATALMTPGINGTITFNHDTHFIEDHETTRDAFPGPLGAWVASVKGPRYLNVTVDVEPDNKFNYFVFKEEGIHTVAIMGKKYFDVATMVNPASVTMNGMKVAKIDDKPVYDVRDMNGDGIEDLVVMIAVTGDKYKPGRTVAVVKGKLKKLYGGLAILGTDKMTILAKKGDPEFVGWYNMTNGDQRLVYDAMLDAYFYPFLNDMLDMTRKEHQMFIDHLNKNKYGNITDWVFANYEQSDGMKMSFGMMADNLIEFAFPGTPPDAPRTPSSPYLAWPVDPADYFDVTSIQFLPPIFGDMPIPTLNGRIYSGWSVRRDGLDMSLPPDVAIRLGNADDHFVANQMMTPGVNATITFNHDTHDILDHETTRDAFPGPLGAWVASVKGPKYLKIAVDIKPGDDKNEIPFCDGEVMAVALLGNKYFDVAEMVDPASIMVAKMAVKLVDGEPVCHVADVNDDGVNDLVAAVVMNDEKDKDCFTAKVMGYLKNNYGGAAVLGHDLVKFVSDGSNSLAAEPQVKNYPNPFNPETNITFQIPQDAKVTITIFNALGQVVRTLSDDVAYEAGEHQVRWDARDAHGMDVASGVYIYRFKANDFTQVKRMLLIR